MNCPKCGSGTYVMDSRVKGYGVYRRRFCPICCNRFTTHETNSDIFDQFLDQTIAELKTEMASAIDHIKDNFNARKDKKYEAESDT